MQGIKFVNAGADSAVTGPALAVVRPEQPVKQLRWLDQTDRTITWRPYLHQRAFVMRTSNDERALDDVINRIAANSASPLSYETAMNAEISAAGEYITAVGQILRLEPALRNFPDLVREGARDLVAHNRTHDRERLAARQAVIDRVRSDANDIRLTNQKGKQLGDAEDSDKTIEQVYSDRYFERKYEGEDSDSAHSDTGSDTDHDEHEPPRSTRPAGLFSFSSNSSPLHRHALPQPR